MMHLILCKNIWKMSINLFEICNFFKRNFFFIKYWNCDEEKEPKMSNDWFFCLHLANSLFQAAEFQLFSPIETKEYSSHGVFQKHSNTKSAMMRDFNFLIDFPSGWKISVVLFGRKPDVAFHRSYCYPIAFKSRHFIWLSSSDAIYATFFYIPRQLRPKLHQMIHV